jgi:hypothetical protein
MCVAAHVSHTSDNSQHLQLLSCILIIRDARLSLECVCTHAALVDSGAWCEYLWRSTFTVTVSKLGNSHTSSSLPPPLLHLWSLLWHARCLHVGGMTHCMHGVGHDCAQPRTEPCSTRSVRSLPNFSFIFSRNGLLETST